MENAGAGVTNQKTILLSTAIAIALFALALLPSQLLLSQGIDQQSVGEWLAQWLPTSKVHQLLVLLAIGVSVLTVGLPRQFVAIACGYILGVEQGFVLALVATTLACFLTAIISRYVLAGFVHNRYPKQQQGLFRFLSINEFTKALIIRLLPIGSNFLTNVVAGACNIKLTPFVFGSMLGFIPQVLVFNLVGAGISLSSGQHLVIGGSLFGVAMILGYWLYLKERKVLEQ